MRLQKQKALIKPGASYNQEGIVSIMVVSVLIVLLSLVTIGFARLMNRETRQALDRQLGLQSYYAAESGINDAIRYLDGLKASGQPITAIDKCSGDNGKLNQRLSSEPTTTSANAQYSCVLIDPEPSSLLYTIKAGQSKIFSFDQERLSSLLVSWQNSNETKTNNYRPTNNTDFLTTSAWGGKTGALRISIYPIMMKLGVKPFVDPVSNPNGLGPEDWVDDRGLTAKYSRTFFFYPDRASNPNNLLVPVDYFENNGAIISGQCHDSYNTIQQAEFPGPPNSPIYNCNSILNCLPDAHTGGIGSSSLDRTPPPYDPPFGCAPHGPIFPPGGRYNAEYRAEHYVVKITSLYADTDVQIYSAQSDALVPVSLRGAQAIVDSTGKGNDVLRRISARIALSPNGSGVIGTDLGVPEYGLRSAETICKRIRQLTTNTLTVDDSSGGTDSAACDAGTTSTPTPAPAPPPPSGGNGNANYSGNCSVSNPCSGNSTFLITFRNNSTNSPSVVSGCQWIWGDGTQTNNSACLAGQTISHRFPTTPAPKCYSITLRITFNNGQAPATYTNKRTAPTQMGNAC